VTTVSGGSGDDVRVNYDQNGLQTRQRYRRAPVLKGGADSDRYDIGLAGPLGADYDSDTADDGINQLNVYGTDRPTSSFHGLSVDVDHRNGDVEPQTMTIRFSAAACLFTAGKATTPSSSMTTACR
jgi:hypothetical protein